MDTFAAPGTMPPMPRRKPFDLTRLPPEMQQQIAAAGQVSFEDGSTVYADGTATGAGDSVDDYATGPSGDWGTPSMGAMNAGGATSGGGMGGYGGSMTAPATMPEEMSNPLGGPMFRKFRQTTNAPAPGQPGGIGGEMAAENPMDEPLPNPFAPAETPRSVTVPGGASVTGGNPSAAKTSIPDYEQSDSKKTGGYGGRYGRRQTSGARPGSRPMPSGRRR